MMAAKTETDVNDDLVVVDPSDFGASGPMGLPVHVFCLDSHWEARTHFLHSSPATSLAHGLPQY